MCGITGLLSLTGDEDPRMEQLDEAVNCIAHRGPDRQRTYREQSLALGHARLSIIEPGEGGDQPMQDSSGRYILVFNGECYNYKELRRILEGEGASFRSDSDTEVFLEWLISRGVNGLEQVNGFFAFALWDKREEELLLGRDRYGIKPLFVREEEGAILFGSELKALMAFGFDRELCREALQLYLQLSYIPAPYCILKGVRKLLPGEWIRIGRHKREGGMLDQGRDPEAWQGSFEEAVDRCRELLEDSVKLRLRSDVPLGTFLSGGVDSGILSALAAHHQKPLRTFSIGYEDSSFDESGAARRTAAYLGTEHSEFQVGREEFLSSVSDLLDGLDEPFADSSAIPVQLLSEHTREHAKVALSGDGADELFGGYNKHRGEYMARHPGAKERLAMLGAPLWERLPKGKGKGWKGKARMLDRFARGASLSPEERYWRWASFSPEEDVREILRDPLSPTRTEELRSSLFEGMRFDRMEDVLRADRSFVLPNDMLSKVDRSSMRYGLELRVPYLDHRLVRFVESLPAEWRIDGRERKVLLKRAFRDLLPDGTMDRPKRGFEVPLAEFLRKTYQGEVERLLDPEFLEEQGVFHPGSVKGIVDAWKKGRSEDNGTALWTLLVFQVWWERYLG